MPTQAPASMMILIAKNPDVVMHELLACLAVFLKLQLSSVKLRPNDKLLKGLQMVQCSVLLCLEAVVFG